MGYNESALLCILQAVSETGISGTSYARQEEGAPGMVSRCTPGEVRYWVAGDRCELRRWLQEPPTPSLPVGQLLRVSGMLATNLSLKIQWPEEKEAQRGRERRREDGRREGERVTEQH